MEIPEAGAAFGILTQPMDPEKNSLNFIFPTKNVIPKSLKFSHWLSKLCVCFDRPNLHLILWLSSFHPGRGQEYPIQAYPVNNPSPPNKKETTSVLHQPWR